MHLVQAAIRHTPSVESAGALGQTAWSPVFPTPGPAGNGLLEKPSIALLGALDSERQSLRSRLANAEFQLKACTGVETIFGAFSNSNLIGIGVVDDRGNRSALELIRLSREKGNGTGVIVLARNANFPDCAHAIRSGAIAYLPFSCDVAALTAVLHEARLLSPLLQEEVRQRKEIRAGYDSLTKREAEVLEWLSRGCSNRSIAENLSLAEATVKIHRRHVMSKMNVLSLAELLFKYQLIAVTKNSVGGRWNR